MAKPSIDTIRKFVANKPIKIKYVWPTMVFLQIIDLLHNKNCPGTFGRGLYVTGTLYLFQEDQTDAKGSSNTSYGDQRCTHAIV